MSRVYDQSIINDKKDLHQNCNYRVNCGYVNSKHLVLGCSDSSIRLHNKSGRSANSTTESHSISAAAAAATSSSDSRDRIYQPDVSKIHLN